MATTAVGAMARLARAFSDDDVRQLFDLLVTHYGVNNASSLLGVSKAVISKARRGVSRPSDETILAALRLLLSDPETRSDALIIILNVTKAFIGDVLSLISSAAADSSPAVVKRVLNMVAPILGLDKLPQASQYAY